MTRELHVEAPSRMVVAEYPMPEIWLNGSVPCTRPRSGFGGHDDLRG